MWALFSCILSSYSTITIRPNFHTRPYSRLLRVFLARKNIYKRRYWAQNWTSQDGQTGLAYPIYSHFPTLLFLFFLVQWSFTASNILCAYIVVAAVAHCVGARVQLQLLQRRILQNDSKRKVNDKEKDLSSCCYCGCRRLRKAGVKGDDFFYIYFFFS